MQAYHTVLPLIGLSVQGPARVRSKVANKGQGNREPGTEPAKQAEHKAFNRVGPYLILVSTFISLSKLVGI